MSDPRPLFALSAAPIEGATFPRFFEAGRVRELLEHPGELRHAGFDLQTGGEARIVRGEFLEVGIADWKRLRLYEDGTLIARVPADEDFLGWAAIRRGAQSFWEHPRLNPIALVEFVYTFTDLYRRLAEMLQPTPSRARFRAEFRHLVNGDARVYVTPHGVDTLAWTTERVKYPAPESEMQKETDIESQVLQTRPQQAAYLLIERIYTWFGAKPEEIPYVARQGNSVPMVDVATLKRGGKKET
jgi:hypothetical protein